MKPGSRTTHLLKWLNGRFGLTSVVVLFPTKRITARRTSRLLVVDQVPVPLLGHGLKCHTYTYKTMGLIWQDEWEDVAGDLGGHLGTGV